MYKSKYWISKLAEQYQNNVEQVSIYHLLPAIRILVSNISLLLKAQKAYPSNLKKMFQCLISNQYKPGQFQSIVFPTTIETAKIKGEEELGKYVATALIELRNLYEGNKEFFYNEFKERLPVQNQQKFLQCYMQIISKITETHISYVIQNMENMIKQTDNHSSFFNTKERNKVQFSPSPENHSFV